MNIGIFDDAVQNALSVDLEWEQKEAVVEYFKFVVFVGETEDNRGTKDVWPPRYVPRVFRIGST
jgi:hypothetical protein